MEIGKLTEDYEVSAVNDAGTYIYILYIAPTIKARKRVLIKRIKSDNSELKFVAMATDGDIATFWDDRVTHTYVYANVV